MHAEDKADAESYLQLFSFGTKASLETILKKTKAVSTGMNDTDG